MSNADTEPWAPDPAKVPGTPPVGGTGGERGTSAFPGTSHFNHDGTRKAGYMGPDTGASYHSDGVSIATGAGGGVSSAGSHAPDSVAVALTAADDAPTHAVADLLTATFTPSADYPVTGLVTFKDGATTLGTHTLVSGDNNVATFNVSAGFTAGAHSLTAVYAGDSNYSGVTSAPHVVTAS